jgi:hypothetical protein
VEAPPFTWREPFAREGNKLEKEERRGEERRDIIREEDRSTQKKPQEKEDTVGSVTMISGAMPSTSMG